MCTSLAGRKIDHTPGKLSEPAQRLARACLLPQLSRLTRSGRQSETWRQSPQAPENWAAVWFARAQSRAHRADSHSLLCSPVSLVSQASLVSLPGPTATNQGPRQRPAARALDGARGQRALLSPGPAPRMRGENPRTAECRAQGGQEVAAAAGGATKRWRQHFGGSMIRVPARGWGKMRA